MINFFPPIQERDKKGKKDHIVSFRIPSVFLKSLEYISKANNRSINLQARSFLEECIENFAKRENLVFVSLRIFFSSQLFKRVLISNSEKIKNVFVLHDENMYEIINDVLSKKDVVTDLFFVFSSRLDETSNTPLHLKPPLNLVRLLFSFFHQETLFTETEFLQPGLYDFFVPLDLSFFFFNLSNLISIKLPKLQRKFFADLPLSMFLLEDSETERNAVSWLDVFLSNLDRIDNKDTAFL